MPTALRLQDAHGGLVAFLKDAVPSHKLSDSQAALAALTQPQLDWGELDDTFASLTNRPCSAAAEQIVSQLQRLVQQAALPSLATGLFACAGHLLLRFYESGLEPADCIETVLGLVAKVTHLHSTPHCPATAEVSVAAVNLGTALARDVILHHADTDLLRSVTAFATQLSSAALVASQALDEEQEVPEGMTPWAAAVMSCTYLLALQSKDIRCPKTRAIVLDQLVPQTFVLMELCSSCRKLVSNRAEWLSIVRPAVLLASVPRLLVRQLGLQQTEEQVLEPFGYAGVMQGLVPLLKLLSSWYHPFEYEDVEEDDDDDEEEQDCGSDAEAEGSGEGCGGSKAADMAGSSGGNSAGRGASTSATAEGGGSSSCGSGSNNSSTGAAEEFEGQRRAGEEDRSGSGLAAPQQTEPAVAEPVPRQQVGRALSDTLASLQLLLRNGVGVEHFVQYKGMDMGVDHLYGYEQHLIECKGEQQGAEEAAAGADAASGGGSGTAGQGPPGDDPAHQILVTLIDCLWLVMRGSSREEALYSFLRAGGMLRALDSLDETLLMPELVKQAEQGRPQAWAAKRALLRLIEAVLIDRDSYKADFANNDGFESVWRCISPLGLSPQEEEHLASSNPGLVRGVLGNALSVLSAYGACNFEDELEEFEERCMQLAEWLEGVTTLPDLLALLKWQPRGYDTVQATLQGECACIMGLHPSLLRVARFWAHRSPPQLELLARHPPLRAPFLEALRLPEEHFWQNERAITSCASLMLQLVKEHPSCVLELLEGGITQDLLQLLASSFQKAAREESSLQTALRLGRARGASSSALGRELERRVMDAHHAAVEPYKNAITGAQALLHSLAGGCHKASVLESLAKQQQPREQLTQVLRKSCKFTDASLQKGVRDLQNLLRLAEQAQAQPPTRSVVGGVGVGTDESAASQAAAELLRAEQEAKQREAAKLEKKRRQKEKQRDREERERQEREERERAEREQKAKEEEEQRQRREQQRQAREQQRQQEAELAEQQQAAAGPGQQGKAAKERKKKKAKEAGQLPGTSSSQGAPTLAAAGQTASSDGCSSIQAATAAGVAAAAAAAPGTPLIVANGVPGRWSPEDSTALGTHSNISGEVGRGCSPVDRSSVGRSSSSAVLPGAARRQQAEPSSWPGIRLRECEPGSSRVAEAAARPIAPPHGTTCSPATHVDEQEVEFQALLSQLLPHLSMLSSGPSNSTGAAAALPSTTGAGAAPATATAAAAGKEGGERRGQGGACVLSPALAAVLRCALSGQQLRDPVVAADGWTYERQAITTWLAAGHTRSPRTGQPLGTTVLRPNYALRQLLE